MNLSQPPTLIARTSYLAGSVAQLGRSHITPLLKRHGLRFGQYAVLAALTDLGRLAPHQLATRLRTDRSHISSYLEVLMQRGLIERDPDPADRRRLIVTVTDDGAALAAQISAAAADSEHYLLISLDGAERSDLRRLLHKVLVSHERDD